MKDNGMRKIASLIMGWKYQPGTDEGGYWADRDIAIAEDFWQPDEEIAQTMMVVKKLIASGYRIELYIERQYTVATIRKGTNVWTGFGDTLGQAIIHIVLHMIEDGEFGE